MIPARFVASFSVLSAALLMASPAHAWRHTGNVWTADQMPVVFHIAGDGTEGEFCQDRAIDGRDPDYSCYGTAEYAAAQWNNVPCTDLEVVIAPDFIENTHVFDNGITEVVFEDPDGDFENSPTLDPGTLAFSASRSTGVIVQLNGQFYFQLNDADIVFGKDKNHATNQQIEDQGCSAGTSNLNATLTHEMGHSLGMAHTCEKDDICVDPVLRNATMFWTSPGNGDCDVGQSVLDPDDMQGIQALYGPLATFQCSGENENGSVLGVVPFDLSCAISSNSAPDIVSVNWSWGDGGSSTSLAAGHTYETAGNYTIQVDVNGQSSACEDPETGETGEWSYDYRRVGYVTACDVVQGEFEVDYVDGLTYKMLNDSDVGVYGCISQIQWTVFEGEGTKGKIVEQVSAWEPEFTFAESGTYTVLMNLGGPAGTSGAMVTIDAKPGNGGCSTVTTGAGAFGMLSLLGLLGLRRRS